MHEGFRVSKDGGDCGDVLTLVPAFASKLAAASVLRMDCAWACTVFGGSVHTFIFSMLFSARHSFHQIRTATHIRTPPAPGGDGAPVFMALPVVLLRCSSSTKRGTEGCLRSARTR